MSFGWSAGDIVAASQLVYKVAIALATASSDFQVDSSFLQAVSITLNHLEALQAAAALDPNLAKNLHELCEQIRAPLTTFCCDIQPLFERDLGANSTRPKLRTIGSKMKWALSTSKKVKLLREQIRGPISTIPIVFALQLVQTTQQMPSEIQRRIAQKFDATSQEASATLRAEFETLLKSQTNYILQTVGDQSQKTLETIQNQSLENGTASTNVLAKLESLSAVQSKSASLVVRTVLETGQANMEVVRRQNLDTLAQTSSFHQRLDQMNSLIGTIKDVVDDLSTDQKCSSLSTCSIDVGEAAENVLCIIWKLVPALYSLIRALIYLLAPQLVALYRSSIQPLMLCGDHFLFEDAIGRRKWLPCSQFQHWKVFYKLLVDSFQGERGLSWVRNERFIMMNGFNNFPVPKNAWGSIVQPKSKVAMAMILDTAMIKEGRCPDPFCPGLVEFKTNVARSMCTKCGKHLSLIRESTGADEEIPLETKFLFDRIEYSAASYQPPDDETGSSKSMEITDKDVSAFKRVIWQETKRIVDFTPLTPQTPPDEEACRRRLTNYEVFTIRKIKPHDTEKPTWAKSTITKEPLSQEDIQRATWKLNKRKRSVQDKKAALMPFQQGQVSRLLDELMTGDRDGNFEWSLAQLHSKVIINKKGQKETSTITVYTKRAPREDLNPIGLFNTIKREKQVRLGQMNRPPPARPEQARE